MPCWSCQHFGGSPRRAASRLVGLCLRAEPTLQPEMASGCHHWASAERPALRVLVCGGLEVDDQHAVFHALDLVLTRYRVSVLIHGAARGVDTLADQWAVARGIERQVFPVQPEQWERAGLAASPLRNTRMLVAGRPDALVAFPGGPGTEDMVTQARVAGLPVWRPYG